MDEIRKSLMYSLYSLPDIARTEIKDETYRKNEKCEPEWKRPCGKPGCSLEGNIKVDLNRNRLLRLG